MNGFNCELKCAQLSRCLFSMVVKLFGTSEIGYSMHFHPEKNSKRWKISAIVKCLYIFEPNETKLMIIVIVASLGYLLFRRVIVFTAANIISDSLEIVSKSLYYSIFSIEMASFVLWNIKKKHSIAFMQFWRERPFVLICLSFIFHLICFRIVYSCYFAYSFSPLRSTVSLRIYALTFPFCFVLFKPIHFNCFSSSVYSVGRIKIG